MPPLQREYRSRNTQYLRISAQAVLLMNLHMDDHYTEWMNDGILERILIALRDRIPTKLKTEGTNKKGPAAKKSIVEVYRGIDYQIAYYFRKTAQRHAVLLKEKTLMFPAAEQNDMPPPPPRHTLPSHKRSREPSTQNFDVDLTQDDIEEDNRPEKRLSSQELVAELPEPVFVVKEEEFDEDFPLPSQAKRQPLFHDDEEEDRYSQNVTQEDVKPEFDLDQFEGIKPTLKVNYTGYSIFGRTLVVIVEPFPAMNPAAYAVRASIGPVEVRELSASVQPESYRGKSTASATPALETARFQLPLGRSASLLKGKGKPLFRPSASVTPQPEQDEEALRSFRESSQAVVDTWEDDYEEEAELPTISQIYGNRK